MANEWRRQLERLGASFERIACRSAGVFHLMVEHRQGNDDVENPDDVRYLEPAGSEDRNLLQVIDTLPGDAPRFRALTPEEVVSAPPPSVDEPYVRDQNGKPHAVREAGVLRTGRLEGRRRIDLHQVQTLGDAAGRVFRSIPPDALSLLPDDVRELARIQVAVMRRIQFGDVPERPAGWLGKGWQAGIAMYERGVVIDYTEGPTGSDAGLSLWLLLLHRLGWHGGRDSLLRARRWYWRKNESYSYEMVQRQVPGLPVKMFGDIPRHRFASVIGDSVRSRIDVCWASRWAIDDIITRYFQKLWTAATG